MPLLLWAVGMVPVALITFWWMLDASLPWFDWQGYCRISFVGVLPVALVSWLLALIHIRDWQREGDRVERLHRGGGR
jgi:hypothetical protein